MMKWNWVHAWTAALVCCGCMACNPGENAEGPAPAGVVRCCKVDAADLQQDFDQAIFSENGFCIMGRPHDEGYVLTLGHVDSLDKSIIVCCDFDSRPREIFAEEVLICLNDLPDGSIYVDIFAEGEEAYGFLCSTGYSPKTMTRGEIGDNVASTISLGLTLQSLKEYSEVVFGPAKNYLKPEYAQVYSKAGKALSIPGLIFSAIGLAGCAVDMPRWVENLTNAGALATDIAFWAKFGGGAIGGPVTMFVGSYLGLYLRYRELYEEHIEVLYGECTATTGEASVSGTAAVLSGEITGYEPWYDLQCGVTLASYAHTPLLQVTGNGVFSQTVEGLEPGKTYRYRAFVISETRMSLWAGVLGDLFGPLVRYGTWKKFTTPEEVSIVGKWGCNHSKYIMSSGDVKEGGSELTSDSWYLTFNPDFTGEYRDKGERETMRYELKSGEDGKLLLVLRGLSAERHGATTKTYQVLQLTDSELYLYNADSDGRYWYNFKRVAD